MRYIMARSWWSVKLFSSELQAYGNFDTLSKVTRYKFLPDRFGTRVLLHAPPVLVMWKYHGLLHVYIHGTVDRVILEGVI